MGRGPSGVLSQDRQIKPNALMFSSTRGFQVTLGAASLWDFLSCGPFHALCLPQMRSDVTTWGRPH